MKQFGTFFLVLLLMSACQHAEQVDNSVDRMGDAPGNTSAQNAAANTGSFAPPISPGDSPTTQLITKDYWVIEYYVPFDDDYNKKMANKGRWYKFKNDGTFVCGQWQEETSHGSWRYGTSVFGRPTIVADAKNDRLDAEWEFQANGDGSEMSWAGQQRFGVEEGTMVKAINLMTMPTKAQFGVE